jgi:hypothetical protein
MILAPLALAAVVAHAQEALKAPPAMFPPVAQLLGAEAAGIKGGDFDLLVMRLRSPEPADRLAAAASLGTVDNIRAVPYLGAMLLQVNEPVDLRVAAAMALGRIRTWRAGVYLKQSVRDQAKEVRFASALALGKSKSRETLPLLIETLQSDPEWWVRFAAAVALGDVRDPLSVNALGKAAVEEKEWQVRMQAVRSLGQMGSRAGQAAARLRRRRARRLRDGLGRHRRPRGAEPAGRRPPRRDGGLPPSSHVGHRQEAASASLTSDVIHMFRNM